MNEEAVTRLQDLTRSLHCTGVEKKDGYLLIGFGELRLFIQSSWRLIEDGEIAVGSSSAELESMNGLAGRVVESVSITNDFNDLRILFTDRSVFESFADAESHEHWTFHSSDGELFVAGPGKLWSSFSPSS